MTSSCCIVLDNGVKHKNGSCDSVELNIHFSGVVELFKQLKCLKLSKQPYLSFLPIPGLWLTKMPGTQQRLPFLQLC